MHVLKDNRTKQMSDLIYYVLCDDDPSVLLAQDVKITNNIVSWFDLRMDRTMEVSKIVECDDNKLIFQRKEGDIRVGRIYSLAPLTLDIYRNKVMQKVINAVQVTSLEELKIFLNNLGGLY